MIEDLDGGAGASSRRGHVLVLSLLLAVGCVVAWAAATSTAFQGPFATPAPSAPVMRYTPAPPINAPVLEGVFSPIYDRGCSIPGATTSQVVFVGGRIVTFTGTQSATFPTCPPVPGPLFAR